MQQPFFNPIFNLSKQEPVIGKNRNTYAKMQREKLKKIKADEKRQRRLNRKKNGLNVSSTDETGDENNSRPTPDSGLPDDD